MRSDLPAVTGRSQSAVVVLDDSASMRRRAAAGETPFERRAPRRARLIEHLSPDSEVALVLASEGSAAPSPSCRAIGPRVLAALDAVTASARRADFAAALRARDADPRPARRAPIALIYVVTDLQAAGWEDVTPALLTGGPEIVVLDASGGAAWSNRAVVGAGAPSRRPKKGAQGIAVVAEIANFAAEPARNLGITLAPRRQRGGARVRRRARGRAARASASSTPSRAAARTRPRW